MVVLSLREINRIIFSRVQPRGWSLRKPIALHLPPIVGSLKGTTKALGLISHLTLCWLLCEWPQGTFFRPPPGLMVSPHFVHLCFNLNAIKPANIVGTFLFISYFWTHQIQTICLLFILIVLLDTSLITHWPVGFILLIFSGVMGFIMLLMIRLFNWELESNCCCFSFQSM